MGAAGALGAVVFFAAGLGGSGRSVFMLGADSVADVLEVVFFEVCLLEGVDFVVGATGVWTGAFDLFLPNCVASFSFLGCILSSRDLYAASGGVVEGSGRSDFFCIVVDFMGSGGFSGCFEVLRAVGILGTFLTWDLPECFKGAGAL